MKFALALLVVCVCLVALPAEVEAQPCPGGKPVDMVTGCVAQTYEEYEWVVRCLLSQYPVCH